MKYSSAPGLSCNIVCFTENVLQAERAQQVGLLVLINEEALGTS